MKIWRRKLMEKLIIKLIIWLSAEVILNLIGLDDLADYSEFIFEKQTIIVPICVQKGKLEFVPLVCSI